MTRYNDINKQLLPRIRLSDSDLKTIISLFLKYFLKEDKLWVFGSRIELNKKGGDIDLYIETYADTAQDALKMKNDLLWDLEQIIGEQKIDIVLNVLKFPCLLPIYDAAKTKGVRIA